MNTEPEKDITSTEPNPYIRTYAKDFASLSGKKLPNELVNDTPTYGSQKSHSNKNHELLQRQSFQSPDESLIISSLDTDKNPVELSTLEKEAEHISDQQLAELTPPSTGSENPQPIDLPKIIPGEIIQKEKGGLFNFHRKEKRAVEQVAEAPENDFAHAYKSPLTAFGEAPSTPSPDSRDAILARLKARLAAEQSTLPSIAPEIVAVPEPIIQAVPIISQPEIIPVPQPSPFHSFSTDFSDRIDDQKASTFSVLAAEKDAAPKRQVPKQRGRNIILPVTVAILLILVGGGAAYTAYVYLKSDSPIPIIATNPSLVSSNAQTTLSGFGVPLQQSLQQLTTGVTTVNSITTVTFNPSTSTGTSSTTPQTGIFSALQLSAPDILLRNIDPQSTVGVINDGSHASVFFVLRVDSYERTFAGMLTWEPTMLQDLGTFYSLYPASQISPVSASTTSQAPAANIPSYSAQPQSTGQFMDEVVDNHDARALKDTNGNTLIVYGYSDKQTLIIARDETAFTQILGRLTSN